MCLAIFKPEDSDIPLEHLKNGFCNHSDGAGMAWAKDGVLHVKKGMFKIEEVLELYEQIKTYPALIHFRKATHGKIDESNCHPFLFNEGKLALIHNGVLKIKCNIEGLSDTGHFVKLVLEPLIMSGVPIDSAPLHYLINTSIETDKMCVMDGLGNCHIFNKDKGEWDKDSGAWYSNTSYKWSFNSNKTTTHRNTTHNHSPRTPIVQPTVCGAGSGACGVPGRTGTGWRKHWDGSDIDDMAYIKFWETNGTDSTPIGPKVVHLIGAGSTESQSTAVLDAEEEVLNEHIDAAGNVVVEPAFTAGEMCEYGWFDEGIEHEIEKFRVELGLSRESALIRIFNER